MRLAPATPGRQPPETTGRLAGRNVSVVTVDQVAAGAARGRFPAAPGSALRTLFTDDPIAAEVAHPLPSLNDDYGRRLHGISLPRWKPFVLWVIG